LRRKSIPRTGGQTEESGSTNLIDVLDHVGWRLLQQHVDPSQ
jgi:hypothetical protein